MPRTPDDPAAGTMRSGAIRLPDATWAALDRLAAEYEPLTAADVHRAIVERGVALAGTHSALGRLRDRRRARQAGRQPKAAS